MEADSRVESFGVESQVGLSRDSLACQLGLDRQVGLGSPGSASQLGEGRMDLACREGLAADRIGVSTRLESAWLVGKG